MESLSLLLALTVGFSHAFEADHLAAVSSMSMRHTNLTAAMKDGVYWGLGHLSTILLIGLVMMAGHWLISNTIFAYFEAIVGLMLIGLGVYRLLPARLAESQHSDDKQHKIAYGVGAVHGLAGSGVLMALVMQQWDSLWLSFGYLLLFGLGSIIGMFLAAGVFSLPFSKRWVSWPGVQQGLVWISALCCIVLGSMIVYENIGG
ncbi:MAG: urease accessory protein [Bacteroidetes bacterium]|nr:MAG: urease accessory protein [Bacteroidota bacterium]